MLIDTTACGFGAATPAYAASVEQLARQLEQKPFLSEEQMPGSLTLMQVGARSFRAVMWDPARPLLKLAAKHGWSVSWIGATGPRAGVTPQHGTGWKDGDWGTIFADVAIGLGSPVQPFGAVPRLFTALVGETSQGDASAAGLQLWRTQGSGAISRPSTASFRASVLPSLAQEGDGVLPGVAAMAEQAGWRVSWIAVPPSDNRVDATGPDDWRNTDRGDPRAEHPGSALESRVFAAARYTDSRPLPGPGVAVSFVCSVVAPHAVRGAFNIPSVDTLPGPTVVTDATPAGFNVYLGAPFARHPAATFPSAVGAVEADTSHWLRAQLLEAGHLQISGWRVEYFEVRTPRASHTGARQSLGGRGSPSVARRERAARGVDAGASATSVVRVDAAVRNERERTMGTSKQAMLCAALEKKLRVPKGAARVAHVMEWDDHLVVEFHIRVEKKVHPTLRGVLEQLKAPKFGSAVSSVLQDSNPEMRFDRLRFSTPTVMDDAPAAGKGQLMVLGAAGAAVTVLALVLYMGVKQGREITHKRKLGHTRKYRSVDQSNVVPEGDEGTDSDREEQASLI